VPNPTLPIEVVVQNMRRYRRVSELTRDQREELNHWGSIAHLALLPVGPDRWSSGGPAEERHGIPLSQLLAMALEATRVICAT
jgi:hypothetical protein